MSTGITVVILELIPGVINNMNIYNVKMFQCLNMLKYIYKYKKHLLENISYNVLLDES